MNPWTGLDTNRNGTEPERTASRFIKLFSNRCESMRTTGTLINLVDTLEYFWGDGSCFYAVIRCPRVSHGAPRERPSRPRSYISATNSSKGVWQEWQESLKGLTVSKKNVGCRTIVLEENVSLTTSRLSHKAGLQESCENAFHGRECSHK